VFSEIDKNNFLLRGTVNIPKQLLIDKAIQYKYLVYHPNKPESKQFILEFINKKTYNNDVVNRFLRIPKERLQAADGLF